MQAALRSVPHYKDYRQLEVNPDCRVKSLVVFELHCDQARFYEGMVAETGSERKLLHVLVRCWLGSELCWELVWARTS